ncbi:MAG: fused MFS/spermidine synthase [Usitatibacter sp.]
MASIQVSEQKGVRYLHFGSRCVQGAMRIGRPWALELEYTRLMMMPLAVHPSREWPASVLQIGLGSASFTRFLHRHRPQARITVVEILPEVVAAARQFFKLPEDERVRIEIADGHDWLIGTRRRFDLILVDAFDAKGRSGMIDSEPFYINCRDHLARGGIASFNLMTRTRAAAPAIARMRAAFGERVWVLPQSEAGNVAVLAGVKPPSAETLAELRTAARLLKDATGLNLLPALPLTGV